MKLLLLIILFISFNFSYSQTKYLIYFKDKGVSQNMTLTKQLPQYEEALNSLSEKAIERRIKTNGEENIITYEDILIKKDYTDQLTASGIKIKNELTWFNAVSAYLSNEQINYVSSLPFVSKIEPVKVFKVKRRDIESNLFKQTDQSLFNYGNSFTQLDLSDIPQVHALGITGEGVIIGLLDTGFDWKDHESLRDRNVIAEYDFIFNDDNTADEPEDLQGQHAHGTTIFSVAGGFKDSILIGPAFNSSFLLAKTEDIRSETRVEEDNYAAALIWMENFGVDITSSSLGYSDFDDFTYTYQDMNGNTTIVTKAVNLAFERGVVTVTAAGNEGNSSWRYITAPADAYNIISVGNVTSNNNVASSSGRGPTSDGRIKPEIVAQGTGVFGASHTSLDAYGFYGGTSLAAPIAAGAAALILSAHPHLKNTQVRNLIIETADNAGSPDNDRGYGLISAARAISFPNLELTSSGTVIHKMFIETPGVDPSSVKLFYTTGNDISFTEVNMNFDGTKFTYTMPSFSQGRNVSFYFTFNDSTGSSGREPSDNSYRYREGELNVHLNLNEIPDSYVLSQNYPNPFNTSTRIDFIARSNEIAELVIIDAAGQKVKMLFNGIAETGINTVIWNGTSDRGYLCASGVYYYILKLEGKEYGKKMILLK